MDYDDEGTILEHWVSSEGDVVKFLVAWEMEKAEKWESGPGYFSDFGCDVVQYVKDFPELAGVFASLTMKEQTKDQKEAQLQMQVIHSSYLAQTSKVASPQEGARNAQQVQEEVSLQKEVPDIITTVARPQKKAAEITPEVERVKEVSFMIACCLFLLVTVLTVWRCCFHRLLSR